MKAWLMSSMTGYASLELAEVADPLPGPGEVVLRVKCAALNPADAWLAKGMYPAKPPLPHVLGRDAIGQVIRIGPDVEGVKVGDSRLMLRNSVGTRRWGTLAEQVVVNAESLVELPVDWSPEQSAAASLVYLTAFQCLTMWDDVPEKAIVLVTGAAGGVGVAAVQLAKAMGHLVIGTSRDEAKRKALAEIGCDQAIDPAVADWPKRLIKTLNDVGVDLAIDAVGGEGFNQVIATLAMHGRVSSFGQSAGPVPNFKTGSLFFKRLRIGGIAVDTYTASETQEAWKQVIRLLKRTGAKPIVDRVYPFDQTRQAFARLEKSPIGKVVIRMP